MGIKGSNPEIEWASAEESRAGWEKKPELPLFKSRAI
jgi:hypothetical protein